MTALGYNLITIPTYPPCPASVEWNPMDVVGATDNPFTLQQQTYDWQASMWTASVMYPPMLPPVAAQWEAFLLALRGVKNAFQIGDPMRLTPIGTAQGSPVVNGENQTGYTLTTNRWTPNQALVLAAGDWIQIGYRLYRITANAASDYLGNATLSIWPNIRESPNGGGSPPVFDPIITSNCVGLFKLKSNSRKWTVPGEDRNYRFQFEIREAI